ncbi:MAG: DUF2333 family protein [Candidatus Binatia bacterium]
MKRIGILVAGIVVACVLAGLLMHLGMKRHAVIEFDPEMPDAVPGERIARALAVVLSHELESMTGWRPNDFILWGPSLFADNNANRQLGIIIAVRETTRVFKDHLTKVSSDQYDGNLVQADTLFRNDAERLWFPSAESRFKAGVRLLEDYIAGLHENPPRSRALNRRNVELIRLFQTWSDMLGDAHSTLYRDDIGFFHTDDVFYHARGAAHAMYYVLLAVHAEYEGGFENRPILDTLIDECASALAQAATLKPLIVLDGGPASIFANHRRNLDAYVNEARQKMYSIREELEK